MKKSFILLSVILLTNLLNAQVNSSKETKDIYIQKRNRANTAGFIALGTGLACILVSNLTEKSSSGVSSATGFVGSFAILGSIPFFISAGKNNRKAKLALNLESLPFKNHYTLKQKFPALAFSIFL